jgi:predicted HNH restriction endonuclease
MPVFDVLQKNGMTKSLNQTNQFSAKSVLEAHELNAGRSKGIFCKILTEASEAKWVVLSGARLSTTPSSSLSNSDNYARAYANYQAALKLTKSGALKENYVLPQEGSESQCLTIIQGTPSSRRHAKRHLRTLSDEEIDTLFKKDQSENYKSIEDVRSPEEIPTEGGEFTEGTFSRIEVNRYERDPKARARCIEHWGTSCQVCSFSFTETYGDIGEGFIHVHHIKPISEIGQKYKVDPVRDLIPVCPNCHAMLHKTTPPLSIAELKQQMKNKGRTRQ